MNVTYLAEAFFDKIDFHWQQEVREAVGVGLFPSIQRKS